MTAVGPTIELARERAYQSVERLHFPGMHFRKDIAKDVLSPRPEEG